MPRRAYVLVENDYQELEVWYPVLRLREAGFHVTLVGRTGTGPAYKGRHGYPCTADCSASDVRGTTPEVLIVPGGWAPDKLRLDPAVLDLVRRTDRAGGCIGAICHAGSVLASAGILKGRTVTSYPSIRDDMVNAGATWVDVEVHVDGHLVTSRVPEDLPGFLREILRVAGPA